MNLETYYQSLSAEERALQFGVETADPLTEAFPRKRVVHAGLQGQVLPADQAQDIWQRLMAQRPDRNRLQTAYIHIPFCKTKCLYCGFFQNGTNQDEEDHYIDCLVQELEMAADQPRLRDGLIHAVFIGGGTPTSLSAANARRLLQTIRRCLPLANDYELTLEGRIHDLVPEKMETWLRCGVNRVSLGVQSFHTQIRRQVGRLDDQDTVLKNLAALKAYEQCAVVIDLIYGLPGQTERVWKEDLDALVASGVDGADLYQLNVFEDSDLSRAIESGRLPPAATTEEEAHLFALARDYMDRHAWKRLNICHWSCSNRERSLYNCLARSHAAMFPFGSGAGGHIDGYSTMLHRSLLPYEAMIEHGQKPFMALIKQNDLQNLVDTVQQQLEQGYLNLDGLAAARPELAGLRWLYQLWEKRGLVQDTGVLCKLTAAGEFWQVNVTQTTLECMQYLLTGKNGLAMEGIAAQDSQKVRDIVARMKAMKNHSSGMTDKIRAMQLMAETMKQLRPDEIQAVMKHMMD